MSETMGTENTDRPSGNEHEKKKSKSPAGAKARYAAIKRLIAVYPDDFKALYAEEAAKLGVKTRESTKAQRIAVYEKKLAELRAK
jgi:hypothetical protein